MDMFPCSQKRQRHSAYPIEPRGDGGIAISHTIVTKIDIKGKHNQIVIEDFSRLNNCCIYIRGDNNKIIIGKKCSLNNVEFYIDLENNRINPSQDIKIGNHVWVGTKVTCLKNTEIADNCIIGATSTLCGKYLKPNCVIGGVPAKILKENVNWLRERI